MLYGLWRASLCIRGCNDTHRPQGADKFPQKVMFVQLHAWLVLIKQSKLQFLDFFKTIIDHKLLGERWIEVVHSSLRSVNLKNKKASEPISGFFRFLQIRRTFYLLSGEWGVPFQNPSDPLTSIKETHEEGGGDTQEELGTKQFTNILD